MSSSGWMLEYAIYTHYLRTKVVQLLYFFLPLWHHFSPQWVSFFTCLCPISGLYEILVPSPLKWFGGGGLQVMSLRGWDALQGPTVEKYGRQPDWLSITASVQEQLFLNNNNNLLKWTSFIWKLWGEIWKVSAFILTLGVVRKWPHLICFSLLGYVCKSRDAWRGCQHCMKGRMLVLYVCACSVCSWMYMLFVQVFPKTL